MDSEISELLVSSIIKSPKNGNNCELYLGKEIISDENQKWNLPNSSLDNNLISLKAGNNNDARSNVVCVRSQSTIFTPNNNCYKNIDEDLNSSSRSSILVNCKKYEFYNNGFITPRIEVISPNIDNNLNSSNDNFNFSSITNTSIRNTYTEFKNSELQTEGEINNCNSRVYNFSENTFNIVNLESKTNLDSNSNNNTQNFIYNLNRDERIYSEYQSGTEKDVCIYNNSSYYNDSNTIQPCVSSNNDNDSISLETQSNYNLRLSNSLYSNPENTNLSEYNEFSSINANSLVMNNISSKITNTCISNSITILDPNISYNNDQSSYLRLERTYESSDNYYTYNNTNLNNYNQMELSDEYCIRKRRRSGSNNDRNFYIVDFICELPVNIKNLFMNIVKESIDGSLILRNFSLGSLAMRRSGNVAPTVIKCFFHSYRDGISRLQCKSKRHEGRPFLFVINETKLSRPWVFCPNIKCIKRAKSSGKLKGRIKVYEYCPGSDRIILSPTFLKCARGFLTSDYYFCATLCPQQKYADHESNFWGEDFVTGFGGNKIQESLTSETENGGSGLTLSDYILFCNSKHQFVATFKRFTLKNIQSSQSSKASYVNASTGDDIFGDEIELGLVNIMTSVIRNLECSNEPTVYASTDKCIQEVSFDNFQNSIEIKTNSSNNNIKLQGHINLQSQSLDPNNSSASNSMPSSIIESNNNNINNISSNNNASNNINTGNNTGSNTNNTILSQWCENFNTNNLNINQNINSQLYNNTNSPQNNLLHKSSNLYISNSIDADDIYLNKYETYSTGYTDEDSYSNFNDSGMQFTVNFDPQDAMVVESSTNWVLDVLLNKNSSYNKTPRVSPVYCEEKGISLKNINGNSQIIVPSNVNHSTVDNGQNQYSNCNYDINYERQFHDSNVKVSSISSENESNKNGIY